MADVIEMPKLSDTMEEGAIAKWLKQEGDFVEEGAAFVEIETDKATMEYNAPSEGYLLKILVPQGKNCALNAPICVLGKKGEAFDPSMLSSKSAKTAASAAAPSEKVGGAATHGALPHEGHAASKAETMPRGEERLRASPLARKVAKEHNIDLSPLKGSGPHGRVIIRDIEAKLKEGAQPLKHRSESQSADLADTLIPVSMMRKTIAKRLLSGKNEAPHFYLTVSANMTQLNQWRAKLNADTKEAKVSVNDLLVAAVSKALAKHKGVNASWEGEHIRQYAGVHVAIAVALPTGLVTPVIRNARSLGVREIAIKSQELVNKARQGQLGNEDYSGASFTISNLGMFGIEEFTAIINPPQAAILAVGATIATPWVRNDVVVIEPRMKLTLSCDHRVIDGAMGAEFLKTLVAFIEDPLMMLA